ncbi:MAG TPA: efflux RND transporter periplasmic adaptor subunit [Steroidobacteraceae bacterium]|nr:efflux RND transporter periplasmic adaptor subunit [Steroidobacteraceae bacterium]
MGPLTESNAAQNEQPAAWIGRQDAANIAENADTVPPPSRWTPARKALVGVAAVLGVVGLGAALYFGTSGGSESTTTEGAIPLVSAAMPGVSPITTTVAFTGTINARYDMPIGTEGETGRVAAIYVEAGDHVKAGQLLAQVDDSVLRPQVDRLAASLEEAKANSGLAAAEYGRAQGVEAAGALSKEDIEKRRAAAVTAAAEVKVAAAQLAEYQARLSHTQVRAPVDGVVLTRAAEVGQIVTPGGNAMFRLARGAEVEMRALVAEQDMSSLRVGQSADVYLTGIDKPFAGKVRLLGAVIDPQTRLGEVRIQLPPDPQLRPGAFARGEVVVGKGARPVLPQTAILSDEKGTFALVVNADNRVERRNVHVSDTNAQGLVIASGLSGNERVIMTAAGFLRVGERVEVAGRSKAP